MNRHFRTAATVVLLSLAAAGVACSGEDKEETNVNDLKNVMDVALSQSAGQQPAGGSTTIQEAAVQPTQATAPTQVAAVPTNAQASAPNQPAQPQTVNGRARRGPGSFSANEAVIGYEIVINGLKYRLCYLASAPAAGTVSDGVVNPFPGEIIYGPCGQGVQNPDTVNGFARRGAGNFSQGEAVVGYEIVINGLKYRLCYLASAPSSGTVSDGVINPFQGEVTFPPCGQGVQDPDTVNGKHRRDCPASGSSCSFAAGEAVKGFFTINGRNYEDCYFASAPAAGTIPPGGASVNPWKNEVAGARVC